MKEFQKEYDRVFWSFFGIWLVFFAIISVWFKGAFFGFAIGALTSYILHKITTIFVSFRFKTRWFAYSLISLKYFIFIVIVSLVLYGIWAINSRIFTLKNYVNKLQLWTLPINIFTLCAGVGINYFIVFVQYIYLKKKSKKRR
ncbi:hypothetical protein BCF59_0050 [Mycoplasmopsis mustelae]|uniref:Uncharacterized protein n=1 Tax=Mycoplasmopsis mustelae TaxID=171289 RepID=A0A4R7UDI3_9BACT|nr:hypothetical protein [Mycoplasmopsis mustelae]TDV24106.1 hypothetical protein BCF59_0050 [Mycoplasmopsis mustelae]